MVSTDLTAITTALADFNAGNVVDVITAALGIAVPLILVWFGFRFIYSKAKGALKRGA